MKIHTFTSIRGVPWVVKLVKAGRLYGFEQGDGRPCIAAPRDFVEFYDGRYDFTHLGQFVSRYHVDTLVERDNERGFNLDGASPDWQITGPEVYRALYMLELVETGD